MTGVYTSTPSAAQQQHNSNSSSSSSAQAHKSTQQIQHTHTHTAVAMRRRKRGRTGRAHRTFTLLRTRATQHSRQQGRTTVTTKLPPHGSSTTLSAVAGKASTRTTTFLTKWRCAAACTTMALCHVRSSREGKATCRRHRRLPLQTLLRGYHVGRHKMHEKRVRVIHKTLALK